MTDKKTKEEDKKDLDNLLSTLQEKFGEGAIMKLGDARKVDVAVIPTGSFSLDLALGVGGLPRGRVVEIYGPESSGKSTLAMNVVAQAQKQGGKAAYIDAEHAMDPEYAAKLGVKINDLLISQPDSGEDALNILDSLVRSGIISVVVVDSVAALTPRAELEGEMGDQHMGRQARMMGQALRKLTALANNTQTLIIFINQIRMKIGVMFGCLNYTSRVNLANGNQEKIGKIVNNKINTEVLSFDWKKNKIVPAKITGWYKNGKANKFLQITVYDPSGSGVAQLSCTTNHPVLTPVGWRRAETLKTSDKVLISSVCRLSEFQKEVIRGSLLGDGNLSPTIHKVSLGTRFRLGHGLKQEKYLLWKASLFKNISGVTYKDKKSIKFDMTPLPELYEMRRSIYINGYKYLPPDFLSTLTPLSLAIWYQDDGCLDIRNKTKDKGRITICVQAIAPESRIILKQYLEQKYDLKSRLGVVRGQEIMYFDQRNSEKFLQLIKYCVHPSMSYKLLPQYKNRFAVEPLFTEPEFRSLAVPIMKIIEKPKTRSMQRFDIRIKGYHNFLADNIIVHNSPETTPGGRALPFAASVRIDVRRIAQVKKGEHVIGNRVKAKVVKNKVAPPFRIAEFDIMFGEGISYEADVLNTAMKYGVVKKSGASYSFGAEKLGTGFDNVRNKLKEDKKLLGEIKKETLVAVKNPETALVKPGEEEKGEEEK